MATIMNGVTCLEARGMEERHVEIARNDYNIEDQYSVIHPDALSDGDPQGKGTGHGGHSAWLPDCSLPKNFINYSNFDTRNGGGSYDIDGRNDISGRKRAMASSLYNNEVEYGLSLINTVANVVDGQVVVGYK